MKVNARKFEGSDEWKIPSTIDAERLKTIEYFKNYDIFPSETEFCRVLSDPQNILIKHRIGTKSKEAEVYQIGHNGLRAALKLMPRISARSVVKNLREIQYAIQASNAVLDDICPYFPIVFAHGKCDNVKFQNETFNYEASSFATGLKLSVGDPRVAEFLSTGRPVEDIHRVLGIQFNWQPGSADFLISELADQDLNEFFGTNNFTENDADLLIYIFNCCFKAVICLQSLKICHGDLHAGNILLYHCFRDEDLIASVSRRKYAEACIPLIHDFGLSEPLTEDNYKKDFKKLCSTFIDRRDILPQSVIEYATDAKTKIQETKTQKAMINIIKSWFD